MHLIINKPPSSSNMLVICPIRAVERLKTTCFRGRNLKLAGNFKLWESLEEMFTSSALKELTDDAWEQWAEGNLETHSLCFEMPEEVGWESTASRTMFQDEELELFSPNGRSTALRVRSSTCHLAHLSRSVTIVYQLENQRGEPKVTIWSLYPGVDIGELDGDITERESRVFFDWKHPGA